MIIIITNNNKMKEPKLLGMRHNPHPPKCTNAPIYLERETARKSKEEEEEEEEETTTIKFGAASLSSLELFL